MITKCIVTSLGSILLGQVDNEKMDEIAIFNPREVQLIQAAANQTKMIVLPLFGKPQVIVLSRKGIMLMYDIEAPDIISLYEESIGLIKRAKPEEIDRLNKGRH